MKKKKIFFMIIILLVFIGIFYFLFVNHYKKANLGNNITKSQEKLEEYILNLSSYEAKVDVSIKSNKTSNRYLLRQQYSSPNRFEQEVIEPENIAGVKIILDGENLSIENSQLSLKEIYENYPYINQNFLSLYDFIQDYKQDENSQYSNTENEIILGAKMRQENPYLKYKKLYLDSKTGLPQKLEVQDNNKNTLVYILYNEIKINSK